MRVLLPIVMLTFALAALPATAEDTLRGVALVIGESKYEALTPLTNPNQDARDIDDLLGDLGFDVDRVLNADAEELREAIDDFIENAADADVALVYYSGHGIEVSGQNYLVPVDTDFSSAETAGEAVVAVAPMLDALANVTPVTIMLLDACRSDPFPEGTVIKLPGSAKGEAVSEQGLAAVRGPTPVARKDVSPESLGAVIGFAAEPGRPALDGAPGENSPYAAALLKHLSAGGFSFGDIMTMVTEEVYLKTKTQQLPWTNSSLRRVLSFGEPIEAVEGDEAAIKGERRKLLLSIAETPATTRGYVEALAGQEQVPLDALYGMLGVLGVKTDDAGGDIEKQLRTGAERLKELLSERAGSAKADPELERLSKLAAEAEAEGAIALALKYRDKASVRADQLLASRQDEAARLKQDMIDIAQTYADNAATAQLNFDHLHAAELFGKAAEAVKDWDDAKTLDYTIRQADALTDRGTYTIDNDAMSRAIELYTATLSVTSKEQAPEDWAKLQGRLGAVKQGLGSRLGDSEVLQASVTAFEAAMTVDTKERAPEEWAKAQNNLGNVLYSIGFRSGEQAVIEKSVAAFEAALSVFTPEADPIRWATAVSNQGGAKLALADAIFAATDDPIVAALQAGNKDADNLPAVVAARAKAVGILTEIITSLKDAEAARPRSDNAYDWAAIEHTRASALSDRGKLTSSTEDFEAAVEAYRSVLTVYDQAHTPVQWTTSATNLAATLRQYAVLTNSVEALSEAVELLHQSIALTPQASSPLDWALMQTKLGNVLSDRLSLDGEAATADAALAAYEAAEEIETPESNPEGWERLQLYKVQALFVVATPTMDRARLQKAYDIAAGAKARLAAAGATDSGFFDQMLPTLSQILEALPK
jgi:uncharacterized caspase-like protein